MDGDATREQIGLISDGLREHYGVKDEDQSETVFKVLANCKTPELQQRMLWCIDEYGSH